MQPALDADGVLVDLHAHLLRLLGFPDEHYDNLKHWELSANPGMPCDDDIWRPVNEQGAKFWADLPLTVYAKEIVHRAGPDAYVVTSPTTIGLAECVAGKVAWFDRHFPHLVSRLIFAKDKGLVAKPSTFLVDDKPENCWRWIETPGAQAILWPAPYNNSSYSDAACRTSLELITHLRFL